MAQTEEFMFQNVAYKPIVYKTGASSTQQKEDFSTFNFGRKRLLSFKQWMNKHQFHNQFRIEIFFVWWWYDGSYGTLACTTYRLVSQWWSSEYQSEAHKPQGRVSRWFLARVCNGNLRVPIPRGPHEIFIPHSPRNKNMDSPKFLIRCSPRSPRNKIKLILSWNRAFMCTQNTIWM